MVNIGNKVPSKRETEAVRVDARRIKNLIESCFRACSRQCLRIRGRWSVANQDDIQTGVK
jgi:hypothetical protein